MLRYWSYLGLSFAITLIGVAAIGGLAWRLLVPPTPLPRFIIGPVEFSLPPGWSCDFADGAYSCESGPPPNDATVIFAVKLRGPKDTMRAFEHHLSHPRNTNGLSKLPAELRSKPHHVWLADHDWIEAVEVNSELQNYVTTYLATVTSYVSVLVTFSAYQPHRARFKRDFEIMEKSLIIHQRS